MIGNMARRASRGSNRLVRSAKAQWRRVWLERMLQELDAVVPPLKSGPVDITQIRYSRAGVLIASLRDGHGAEMVLRAAFDAAGREDLARNHRTITCLAALQLRDNTARLLPAPLGMGHHGTATWQLERRLSGSTATALGGSYVEEAFSALGEIHQIDGHEVTLDQWAIDRLLLDAGDVRSSPRTEVSGTDRILDRIRVGLDGRVTQLGRVHGDLWPGNLLVNGVSGRLTGIVDWDRSNATAPAVLDRLHLELTIRKHRDRRELGEVLAGDLRAGRGLAEAEDAGMAEALRLLYWLHFASLHLNRFPALARDAWWWKHNVTPILEQYNR